MKCKRKSRFTRDFIYSPDTVGTSGVASVETSGVDSVGVSPVTGASITTS